VYQETNGVVTKLCGAEGIFQREEEIMDDAGEKVIDLIFAAIPGEQQNPVTTAISRLPFRKHQCDKTPLPGTI